MTDEMTDKKTEAVNIDELETEKLQLEIEELRNKTGWDDKLGKYLPFFTVLIAVIGLLINNFQFNQKFETEKRNRDDEIKRQNDRDAQLREDDFRKPFWEQQIKLYTEASEAASKIATLPPENAERKKAEENFWILYHGSLVLVEDPEVSKEMAIFGNCLKGFGECDTNIKKSYKLKNLSLSLANQCRKSISESWNVRLDELPMQPLSEDN